jgi:magnesium transporter
MSNGPTKSESRLVKKRSLKLGLAPGTLVHIGEKRTETVRIDVMAYDERRFEERRLGSSTELDQVSNLGVTWIDIGGIHKLDVIENFGLQFRLHPLLLEDIVNTDQRPKYDDYGQYGYLVLKMLYAGQQRTDVHVEQVSLVFGPNYVLTFQENGGDVFNPIRERIRTGKGRIRQLGADYLLHALVDAIVDHYFVALEILGEKVERMQNTIVIEPRPNTLQEIHAVKRELLFLRRAVWPLREMLSSLERQDTPLIKPETKPFFRDVYDHAIQIIDTIETLREMVTGMLDIYLSSVSYRLNSIMKVLTVITTIFMPLTFIVGVYGMNFEYMPELGVPWAYPMVWLVMVSIAAGMLALFRIKQWL